MAKTPDPERLELLQGTLDMLILRTLQWGAQHGHGIGQAISSQSDDLLKVETGSLYPALHRLEKRGWLKSEWGISEANHKAKYYQLTAAGKAQLSRERDRWTQLVDVIGKIMNPRGDRSNAMRPDDHELDDEIRGHLAIDIQQRIDRGEIPQAGARQRAAGSSATCRSCATRCAASGTAAGTTWRRRSRRTCASAFARCCARRAWPPPS